MRAFTSIIAVSFIVTLCGCAAQDQSATPSPEMMPQTSIAADPGTAIRAALPADWSVQEVVANTYPFYRPEGRGTGIKLISKAHKGDKPPYDAMLFIMPADYVDGGEDPTHGQAQTTPPQLVCEASNGKVYLWAWGAGSWPTIREDICRALVQH